jgi:hypothetical protein
MADACNITARAGASQSRGYEDAVSARIQGELEEIESDLPEDVKQEAVRTFRAAVHDRLAIKDGVERVQKELKEMVDVAYKGQRLKGFVKMDYGEHVVTIQVNKFGGGNAQFSAGVGTKKMVCPDPFMGRLADPNMHK